MRSTTSSYPTGRKYNNKGRYRNLELKKHNTSGVCCNYVECGDGPLMHFAHANGFLPGVYENLFSRLESEFSVLGMNFCCQSHCFHDCDKGKPFLKRWYQLSDELIEFLEAMNANRIIGVGHSMGGVVTALASIRRPELFRKLILLDPVFLEPRIIRLARISFALRQQHRNPLAIRARKRKNGWKNRDEAFEFFMDKPLFGGWEEEVLRSYTEHGLIDSNGEVRLACPPDVEAAVFETYPTEIWSRVKTIKVPCTVVRGELSDVVTDNSWKHLARLRPDIRRVEMPGLGHLFPMQDTEATARLLLDIAQEK